MPSTLLHDQTDAHPYFLTPESKLEGMWGALASLRAEWFRTRRRRLIAPSVVLQVANLALLFRSLATPGASTTAFTVTQVSVSAAAMWLSALCGFGFPLVPDWARSSHQYLSTHAPEMLGEVPAMRHLTQFGPSVYGWWVPGSELTDAQILDSLAAFVAVGGFHGIPASWLTDPAPTATEAFEILGYDHWLEQQHLSGPAREVYDQLLGEYAGSLGQLITASTALAD